MGLLPTAQRFALWRPDVYQSDLCPRCHRAPETSDHLFTCPVNALTADAFAARFREELASALPVAHVHAAPLIANVLLSSGLSLAGFRGVLPQSCLALLAETPIPLPTSISGLAVLRALFQVAYHDVWKPRCEATIALERLRGVTTRQKRLAPEDRPAAESNVDRSAVPAVLNGQSHTRSIAFGQSYAKDQALWQCSIDHHQQVGGL